MSFKQAKQTVQSLGLVLVRDTKRSEYTVLDQQTAESFNTSDLTDAVMTARQMAAEVALR